MFLVIYRNEIKNACKARFQCLKKNHDQRIQEILNDVSNFKKPYEKNINFTKALTKEQEEDLYKKIIKRLRNKEIVTVRDIADMALKSYYSPLGLSLKALINSKIKSGQQSYDKDGNIVIDNLDEELNQLLILVYDQPQQLIENYDIKDFQTSRTWIFKFMIRHGLVFRKPNMKSEVKLITTK